MPRPLRIVIIFLGLLIICLSIAVMIFINLPIDSQSIQATLEPTLFVSP